MRKSVLRLYYVYTRLLFVYTFIACVSWMHAQSLPAKRETLLILT